MNGWNYTVRLYRPRAEILNGKWKFPAEAGDLSVSAHDRARHLCLDRPDHSRGERHAVFCIAGWLPGHIAKTRGHPWADAVTVAGWITLICGFALWPVALIWAYVDIPRRDAETRP